MTYPPTRHHGSATDAATFRRAEQAPDLVFAGGGAVHHLATRALTGGDYGLFRWDMPAGPSGPDPHSHRSVSEAFFILQGVVALYAGTG